MTQRIDFWLTVAVALAWLPSVAVAQGVQNLVFNSTNDEFLNPERGFYRYRNLDSPTNFASVRNDGQSIIYGRVEASDFRDQPLSDAFLAKIQAGFDESRRQGLKVKFRLSYNNGFDPDAPKDVILNHIQQLKPLWEKNKDVMFHMDAGFIGAWGEWHSSTNGLDNATDRRDILFAILDALPTDRTIGIRTPHFKREAFTGSQVSDEQIITAENAFDGSRLTRVGHLNDCFLSSSADVGTYVHFNNGWPLSRELDYIGQESLYVPFGGETCGLNDRSLSKIAIPEMETLHIDYLNLDFHPDVISRWKEEGAFDEIQRRMGYRFELKTAELPTAARPGGLVPLEFTIDNVGFGELFNPRNVEVTLTHNETGNQHTAPLSLDPRHWSGGKTNEVSTWLALPEALPSGEYSVGLWMPDIEPSLRNDVRYAIRFANEGVWNEATGINTLTTELNVSKDADGKVYDDANSFREVVDPSLLNLRGDFNGNNVLDTEDIDTLTAQLGNTNPLYDLTGDGLINELDRTYWVHDLAQTQFGDADLNGKVEFADFLILSSSFGSAGGWSDANFDANPTIDFSDFLALSANFGSNNQELTSVPEPLSLCWPCILTALAAQRKERSQNSPIRHRRHRV